ncbi:MAG TPA: hypothetical protein VL156_19540 [Terriglobales bacterium]|jgi:hypothetical protein|nr:hypothetical protein [Terriglobales bacterium]
MTVYVNKNCCAYNLQMRQAVKRLGPRGRSLLIIGSCALAWMGQSASQPEIRSEKLPPAGLWNPYSFTLETKDRTESLHWRMASGSLPHNLHLREQGVIEGVVNELGRFDLAVIAIGPTGDRSKPKRYTLQVEPALKADWSQKSRVNGNRIDGSVKVSNTTGRDFDLTFAVLAVNEIGRATAIGYQHFTLKKNTREMELPFGDTLSPGTYVVHIDVVAEEPESKMILRTRMAAPKQTIAPVL